MKRSREKSPRRLGDMPFTIAEQIIAPLDAMTKKSLRLTSKALKSVVDSGPMTYEQVTMVVDRDVKTIRIGMLIDQENRLELEFNKTDTGVVVRNQKEAWRKEEISRDPQTLFLKKAFEHFMKIFPNGKTTVKDLVFQFEGPDENVEFDEFYNYRNETLSKFLTTFKTLLEKSKCRLNVEHVKFLNNIASAPTIKKLLSCLEPGRLEKISSHGLYNHYEISSITETEQFQRAKEFISDCFITFNAKLLIHSLNSRLVQENSTTEYAIDDLLTEVTTLQGQWRTIRAAYKHRDTFERTLASVDDQTPVELRGPDKKLLKIRDSDDMVQVEVLEREVVFTKITNL